MRRLFLLPFVSIALIAFAAQAPGLDPECLARIGPRMQSFVDRGQVAGIVTLLARHGQVAHLNAVGYQDTETKKPMRTDSIFQIMSMTKPVTGVGVMILAEEGRLGLNDAVEKYLPEFRGQKTVKSHDAGSTTLVKPSRPITIRDLMTHSSGMGDPPPGLDLYTKMDRTLAEAVAIYSQQPLDFEPGTRWQYSNMGIATLGRIIEVVADQPYERFIDERIFKAIGMKDSFFFPPTEKVGRIALVHTTENGSLTRSGPGILGGDSAKYRKGARYPAPEFGLYSTASDLAAFYQMMLNGGTYQGKRILSREGVDVMTTIQDPNLPQPASWWPGAGYALTWEVIKDPIGTLSYLSPGTFGHGGAFDTHGWVDRKKDLVGVFLVQTSGGPGGDDAKIAFMTMAGAAVTD
jgi:CubicO group peptidase (beta-lactamase class C family)